MKKTIIRILTLLPAFFVTDAAIAKNKAPPTSNAQIQLSFAPVVKKVSPAVVNIYTKRNVARGVRHPFADDPFFAPFFRNKSFGQRMRRQAESALGSGIIVDSGGLIVTNAHVVKGASAITVILSDGREFDAKLALSDSASDIALLRIDGKGENLPHASLRASESLEVGDLVLAIGNPFGVGQTVTSGIVSAQGRSSLNINDFNFFIQTDAAINPGNSGGPLVTLDGGVVGINTAIYSRDGGSLGIGFAVPSDMVATIIAAEKSGRVGKQGVIRPWLGVTAQRVSSDIGESLALEAPRGALIKALHKASPLRKAGLKIGDVVLRVNGKDIQGPSEMKFRMATVPIGEKTEMVVARQGRNVRFLVEAIAPPEDPPREETRLEGRHILNGAVIANLNPAIAVELGVLVNDEGVIILKTPANSAAARVVAPGDVLKEINGRKIEDIDDVKKALEKGYQNGWSLTVNSQGREKQIRVR